jgi:hypothetical protein
LNLGPIETRAIEMRPIEMRWTGAFRPSRTRCDKRNTIACSLQTIV